MGLKNIEADEEGRKRRKADYTLLRYLQHVGEKEGSEIDAEIKRVHEELLKADVESPFYFKPGSGSFDPISSELNQAIGRSIYHNRIEVQNSNIMTVTEKGKNYLSNDEKLERHRVDEEYQNAVGEALKTL